MFKKLIKQDYLQLYCQTTIFRIVYYRLLYRMVLYILTSASNIKVLALRSVINKNDDIVCIDTDGCNNPAQPVGIGGIMCCKRRIAYILETQLDRLKELCKCVSVDEVTIVSIENAIEINGSGVPIDVPHIFVKKIENINDPTFIDDLTLRYERGQSLTFPIELFHKGYTRHLNNIKNKNVIQSSLGWDTTIGDIYHEVYNYDSKNWCKRVHGVDRVDQILLGLCKFDFKRV